MLTILEKLVKFFITIVLFQLVIGFSLAQADSCQQGRKCLELLGKQGVDLSLDWKKAMSKMVEKYKQLEEERRKFLEVADNVSSRSDLYKLKKVRKELEASDKEFEKIITTCEKELKKIGKLNLWELSVVDKEKKEKQEKKFSELADDEDDKYRPRGLRKMFTRRATPYTKREISSLNEEDLNLVFNYLRKQEEIPFKFPDDACYARAHRMVDLIEENIGLKSGKVFIHSDRECRLVAKTPFHPDGKVNWNYHVAPYLYLKENGTKTPMVLDPSLFDRPVTVDEWVKYQAVGIVKRNNLDYTSARVFLPTDIDKSSSEIENNEEADEIVTDVCLRHYKFLEKDRLKSLGFAADSASDC